jgi:hypothetical protein
VDIDGVLGLETGFIDHFNTQLITTLNYNTIADLHTLHITGAYAKAFPACSVFISSCPVSASNNGYSFASGLMSSMNGSSLATAEFLLQLSSL